MKHRILLCLCVLTCCFSSFAQTPIYLTKAYKPVEADLYETYSSREIQGGDTWNNCFTLGVINNYHGHAVFHIGGNDPNIVQIHADGRRIFDYVLRDGDLGQHFTLNISGVDKLEFSLVKPEVEAAFCEVALWTKGETPPPSETAKVRNFSE